MKLIKYFSFLSFLVFHNTVYSQLVEPTFEKYSAPSLIEPSPEAFSIGKFGFQSPNFFVGKPNISIPIYSLEFEDIVIPINLIYDMPGFKTKQEASWVGLGWTLNSTATITRKINSGDDLYNPNDFRRGYIYLPDFQNAPKPPKEGSDDLIVGAGMYSDIQAQPNLECYIYDTEQDIFSASIFGDNLKFVLSKYSTAVNNIIRGKCLNSKGYKIELNLTTNDFSITFPNGYIYRFEHKLKSRTMSNNWSLCDNWSISSWNLSEIESPYGTKVHFGYKYTTPKVVKGTLNRRFSKNVKYCSYTFGTSTAGVTLPPAYDYDYWIESEENYLGSISTSNESIIFETSNRSDLKEVNGSFTLQKLDKIRLNYKYKDGQNGFTYSQLKKEILFNSNYFESEKLDTNHPKYGSRHKYLRLKLNSVTVGEEKYQFDYNYDPDSQNHPDINKEELNFDYWGYYNAGNYNTLLLPFSVPNFPIPIPRVTMLVNSVPTQWAPQFCSGGNNNGVKREGNFTESSRRVLNKVIYPTKGYTEYIYESHEIKLSDNEIIYWESANPTLSPSGPYRNKQIGGLRIKEMIDRDMFGEIVSKRSFEYSELNNNVSSGKLMNENISSITYHQIYNNPTDPGIGSQLAAIVDEIFEYYKINSDPMTSLHSESNGSHIGYWRVEEVFNHNFDPSQSYRTDRYFKTTTIVDRVPYYKDQCTYSNMPGSHSIMLSNIPYLMSQNPQDKWKSRIASYYSDMQENGTIYKEEHFDIQNTLKQRISYYQSWLIDSEYHLNFVYSRGGGCWNSQGPQVDQYVTYSNDLERYALTGKTVYDYHANGTLQSDYDYTYNNKWKLSSTKYELNNDEYETFLYYLEDFASNATSNLQNLENLNINEYPLKIVETKNGQQIGGQVLELDGIGRVINTYDYRGAITPPTAHNSNQYFPTNYNLETSLNYYGNENRVKEIKPRAGIPSTFLWGYGNKYVLAKIDGLDFSEFQSLNCSYNTNNLSWSNNNSGIESELNSIRSCVENSGYLIETYTMDPLFGIEYKRNISNKISRYEYDQYGRLEKIKNHDNDDVFGFKYHYSKK